MAGRLQKVVAALVAASALSAFAEGPASQSAQPSSTVPVAGGWTARFFVNPTAPAPGLSDDSVIRRNDAAGVSAQFSKRLWRGTRLTVDVVNVFDRGAPFAPGWLAAPAGGRGIRFTLRTAF